MHRDMDLVKVNIVNVETPQRSITLIHDVLSMIAPAVGGASVHPSMDFRANTIRLRFPLCLSALTTDPFTCAIDNGHVHLTPFFVLGVDVRRIPKIKALVNGAINDLAGPIIRCFSPEIHASQVKPDDLHAGSSETAIIHGAPFDSAQTVYKRLTWAGLSVHTPAGSVIPCLDRRFRLGLMRVES